MAVHRLGITLLAIASPVGVAGAADLPRAEEILDRFVEVTGGPAHEKIRNRRERMEFRFSFLDQPTEVVHETAAPNLVRGSAERPDGALSVYGFYKNKAWVREGDDLTWKTGDELKWEAFYANFDLDGNWRPYYSSVRTVAREVFETKRCYKVVAVTKSGLRLTFYFEVKTGLRRGIEAQETRWGEIVRVKRFFFDYREVDGVKLPHQMKSWHDRASRSWTATGKTKSIEHNVDFPKDHFDPATP